MAVPAVGGGIGGSRGTGYERLLCGSIPHPWSLPAMEHVTWNTVERLSTNCQATADGVCGALQDQVRVEREKVSVAPGQALTGRRAASLDELSALADRDTNRTCCCAGRKRKQQPASECSRVGYRCPGRPVRAGRDGESDG